MPQILPHSPAERRYAAAAIGIATLVLLADQLSKLAVVRLMHLGESIPLIPGVFSLTSVRNLGAAWSILSGCGWLLLLISAAVAVAILIWFRRLAEGWGERYLALGAVLGGVCGNSLDRLFRGAVVDFLDVHYYRVWQYPVFNLADVAICCGVGVFILSTLLRRPPGSAGAEA